MQSCRALLVPLRSYGLTWQPYRTLFFRRGPRLPTWTTVPDIELHFRDMMRQMEQLERDVNAAWGQRRSILPTVFEGRANSPMKMYESELDGKYQMHIYMGNGFNPENIKVMLKDRVLTVDAKCDQTSEDGQARMYQECSQKFTLPDRVDPLQVTSKLTPAGVLEIEAPLPPPLDAAKPKEIPIKRE